MIVFVTGQYAGAQYIHPLVKRWEGINENNLEYKIVATGSSVKYWKQHCVKFDSINTKNSKSVDRYLNNINPQLVILSASGKEDLEYIFILQSKQAGIKTINFIDTWTNYKNRFIYNGKKVYPDTILSIDKKCTEEMVDDGIPFELIKEIGQPYLEEVCQNIPVLGNKILITTQPIKKIMGRRLGYDEGDLLQLSFEALDKIGKIDQLYITSHPDSDFNISGYESVDIGVGKGIDDIKHAHTVLGMFSTQMIVGYLWGRKVASIQPKSFGIDPSPLSRWGLIPKIENSKHLSDFIKSPIDNHERKIIIYIITGSLDRLDIFCHQELRIV